MNGIWWRLKFAAAADDWSHSTENNGGASLVLKQQVCNRRHAVCINDPSVFCVCVRNRMALLPTQAFYLLINNSGLASMSLTMAQVYKDHQDEDGFLYMTYASQEMFGQWHPSLSLHILFMLKAAGLCICCKYKKMYILYYLLYVLICVKKLLIKVSGSNKS